MPAGSDRVHSPGSPCSNKAASLPPLAGALRLASQSWTDGAGCAALPLSLCKDVCMWLSRKTCLTAAMATICKVPLHHGIGLRLFCRLRRWAGRQAGRQAVFPCNSRQLWRCTSTPHLREISYVIRHSQKMACYLLFVHTHQNATLIRQSITKVRRCNWLKAG